MSDNESVISEDIDYNSNDGSDSYHASADDYDQDNAGDSKVPERNSREVVSRPPERSKYAFNLDTEVIVVKPTISRVNSSSDNEFNDYSAEFDDASAHSNSIMYSNDFEFDGERSYNEASRRGHLNQRSITEKAPLQPIFKKSILPHHAEFVSLQAEIALEDISKEVVRLRNQQRNLLSERRNVAREKKSRAETRRAQYQVELRDMKQQLTESEGRLELQKSQTDSTQKLLDFALFAKTALESDLAVKEKELSELKFMLTEAHSKITETVSSLANERIEIKAKEEVWASKKEDFKAEILKANMLASVVQKSLDANESR